MSSFVYITCPICNKAALKRRGCVNRSKSIGAPIYCGRVCSGIARRNGKSKDQKKSEKSEYDKIYRAKNAIAIKYKKAAHHKQTYDVEQAAIYRKTRMKYHVEYCRRPYVKNKKRIYDRKRLSKSRFGEFSECFILLQDIRAECLTRQTAYEIDLAKGILNKSTKRKREYGRFNSTKPEIGALGNIGRLA